MPFYFSNSEKIAWGILIISRYPKKDGEEYFRKLDDLKEETKSELKAVFKKHSEKLNSL